MRSLAALSRALRNDTPHSWEAKYEEAQAKFAQSKRELEELASQLEGL